MIPPAPGDPPLLCPFCRIVHGERAEGDPEPLIVGNFHDALAFVPLAPAAWGHVLVIPKRHLISLSDLEYAHAVPLLESIRVVDAMLRRSLKPDGMNLVQSTGAAAGQTIPHLHFHLVPRWDGDHLGDLWEKGREWWTEEGTSNPLGRRTSMAYAIRGT